VTTIETRTVAELAKKWYAWCTREVNSAAAFPMRSSSCGNVLAAKRTGAVARPSCRSAAAGLPECTTHTKLWHADTGWFILTLLPTTGTKLYAKKKGSKLILSEHYLRCNMISEVPYPGMNAGSPWQIGFFYFFNM